MFPHEKSTIAIVSDDEAKAIEIITVSARAASLGSDITLFFLFKGLDVLRNKDDQFVYELVQLAKKLGVRVVACSSYGDESGLSVEDFMEGTHFADFPAYLVACEQARINLVM
ncbi:DsrE/DsrF/DrsH-like family protein [Brevibacillus sp. SYSU BS000544]|uniref:DsrE/DsrF/DrsH-like family protein n=1 Tax=Brevibacillus sp. SYSU BS000544 TaxID=3416443 RepID=UPI003CE59607